MSIAVHVGQCGNQVGAAYWRLAAAAAPPPDADTGPATKLSTKKRPVTTAASTLRRHLFHPRSGQARCILVDSEPKVVHAAGVEPAAVHAEQSGRGNNWASGFSLEPNRALVEATLESLRSEAEAADAFQSVLFSLSLGGGTGSGLGSRLLTTVRDSYPRVYLVVAAVAPSAAAGDTPLQNYNAVLALRHLPELADVVVYKDNDDLLRSARYWKSLSRQRGAESSATGGGPTASPRPPDEGERVSVDELNQLAAGDLAGLTFPTAAATAFGPAARPFDAPTLARTLCPLPSANFVDVRSGVYLPSQPSRKAAATKPLLFHGMSSPRDAEPPTALETLVRRTTQSFARSMSVTIASTAIVRGFGPSSDQMTATAASWLDTTASSRVAWADAPVVNWSDAPAFTTGSASVTLGCNNGHFLPTTRQYLQRARRQFGVRAYVHWYRQSGLEDATFEDAFDRCDALIASYSELVR